MRPTVPVGEVTARAFTISTDTPEAGAAFAWTTTAIMGVQVKAAGHVGLGYTYAYACICNLVGTVLADVVRGCDALDVCRARQAMRRVVRNLGRDGLTATSATELPLWDLKARLLELPLARLPGKLRDEVPVCGSGYFTRYDEGRLADQLSGWSSATGSGSSR